LLGTTKFGSGTSDPIWEGGAGPEGRMLGFRAAVSNQVPDDLTKGAGTNLSAILFGNWSDLVIGQWSGLDIQVDPYSLSSSGGIRVTAFSDLDIAVRHPESFAAITDAVTA
ncbi:MAG: phage major capsid protein, partial [Gammaproteobacteria bacterium]